MAASAAPRLTLSETDRATLSGWLRRRRTAQALALRARIVLACAEPEAGSDSVIAKQLGVSRPTVLKWRLALQSKAWMDCSMRRAAGRLARSWMSTSSA